MTPTEAAPEAAPDDLEVILPVEETLKLALDDGSVAEVRVKRIKTLELLQLMRILTSGFGSGFMTALRMDGQDQDALIRDFLGMLMLALPQAGLEFVSFVQNIVEPLDAKQSVNVQVALSNPDMDAVLEVLEVMAMQEVETFQELVGKAKALWSRVEPAYKNRKSRSKRQGSPRR